MWPGINGTMPGTSYEEYEQFHSDFLVLNSTLFFSLWNNPIHRDKQVWINKQIGFFYWFSVQVSLAHGIPRGLENEGMVGVLLEKEKQLLQ